MPFICAINVAATASRRAVPSILIVAPSGRTKEAVSGLIPAFSSTHSMVMGIVAADEAALNAVKTAADNCLKYTNGFPFLTPSGDEIFAISFRNYYPLKGVTISVPFSRSLKI